MRFHDGIISRDIIKTSTLGTIQYQKVFLFSFGSICITLVILSEVKGEHAVPTVLVCLYMLKKKEEALKYRKNYKWGGDCGGAGVIIDLETTI